MSGETPKKPEEATEFAKQTKFLQAIGEQATSTVEVDYKQVYRPEEAYGDGV